MRNQSPRRCCATVGICIAIFGFAVSVNAQTVTWGVNGAGGSGNWDTSTANWFNGTSNVQWPTGGNAIFAGASGGTVSSFSFGPVVSSMTFNTPGYTIQNGWIQSGSSGLTVTTNVDATINSTLSNSVSAGNVLVKNGPAALSLGGTTDLRAVQVNQGEVRVVGKLRPVFFRCHSGEHPRGDGDASAKRHKCIHGIFDGRRSTLGGVVHPDNQPRTVTLTLYGGGTFGGKLENNGSGILAVRVLTGSNETLTLTNANPYSGSTSISFGTISFAENGSAVNSPVSVSSGRLLLDNSGAVIADRISDSNIVTLNGGAIELQGNITTAVEEVLGPLNLLAGASTITVTQPGSTAAQLTFAGLTRNNHATLNVVGPGVKFDGLSNGGTGIVPPYMTTGNEWATVGGDNRITPWTAYTADINSGSSSDHVKLTASGTTALAAATTKASLNLQNSNPAVDQILDLAGQNLELTSGGILSSGAATSAIRSGSLSTAAPEMIITANNHLTIDSSIVDNGSSTTLTKTGPGTLTLGGTNSFTGTLVITQGTVIVASDANLGLGSAIQTQGGTLRAAADFSTAKGISAAVDTAGFNVEFTGPVNFVSKSGLGI